MLLYALTIFLSAFLLFLVQPLIGRIILPWFGGSAAVWTSCLMFFQMALLAGYLYAHIATTWLRPRIRSLLHIGFLLASLALLPILPGPEWKPADSLHPQIRIVALLLAVVGLPYLLLSTTGPLLQSWYARSRRGGSPYRLYALSNIGSLAALLGYPLLIEPLLRISTQTYMWSAGYGLFVILCCVTAWMNREAPRSISVPSVTPVFKMLALWTALAFCPSALLVAVTRHMTENIAPIPLLWVAPLALYLLSFILTFESERWYRRGFWFVAFVATTAFMLAFLFPDNSNVNVKVIVPIFAAGFLCCAMVCHGELYRLRPDSSSLTWFYLMISLGGALGGLFVGVLSPIAFNNYYELPLALLGTVMLTAATFQQGETALPGPTARIVQWMIFASLAGGLIFLIAYELPRWGSQFYLMRRNFYGVLRVVDIPATETTAALRELENGTINHGSEFMESGRHREPTTYYGSRSGAGIALAHFAGDGPKRVGVIGLGAGTLAAYCEPGDRYTFYEINPLVVTIARDDFYFLRECPGDAKVVLGDARLSLERAAPQNFDVLAVDAFSGDSIPIHLLTVDAVRGYLRHLKPGGMLALHVSNKYLALSEVVSRSASELGLRCVMMTSDADEFAGISHADWVMLSRDASAFTGERWRAGKALKAAKVRLWTDDYSSVLGILK